jgi:protein TonB
VPLFEDLCATRAAGHGPGRAVGVSLTLHVAVVAALVLGPLLLGERLPDLSERATPIFFYDPPPPPPPPLPLGQGRPEGGRRHESAPNPTPPPSATALVAPQSALAPPTTGEVLLDQPGGVPEGSALGTSEGMEGGIEGGVVGGVPGGVLGGVLGGTGTGPIPVFDYERPPRPLRTPKPVYPHEAFVRKVQGVVLVEILIDDTGRVVRARVIQSVPLLDEAALTAVRAWIFTPAIKKGRPVATLARAPISFTLY